MDYSQRRLERSSAGFFFIFFDVSQVSVWLTERNVVALDENWREPTNLQAKLLKHQSFEAEVLANRYRVDSLTKVGVYFIFV